MSLCLSGFRKKRRDRNRQRLGYGCRKRAEIYRRLLDRYRLRADECLFIDDNAQNIEAAIALGFAAVRFDNPATAPQRILALLDENDA